MRQNSPFFPFL